MYRIRKKVPKPREEPYTQPLQPAAERETHQTPSAMDQYTKENRTLKNIGKGLGMTGIIIGGTLYVLYKIIRNPVGGTLVFGGLGGVIANAIYKASVTPGIDVLPDYYTSGEAVAVTVAVIVGGLAGYGISRIGR